MFNRLYSLLLQSTLLDERIMDREMGLIDALLYTFVI